MRGRFVAMMFVSGSLATGAVSSQSRPDARVTEHSFSGTLSHPGDDPVTLARALVSGEHPMEALALLQRLPRRVRTEPAVTVARAIATFASLHPALEPASVRALPSDEQVGVERVVAALSPWVSSHADDALAALSLGRAEMVLGNLDAASVALDTATHAQPSDPVPWNDRAMVLVALHRLPDAERCLDEATRLAASDAEPWDNLGAVRLARGLSRQAVEAFQRASELHPQDGRYLSDLASAELSAGDSMGAVTTYARAAALDPADGVIAANHGYALALANRLDEALTELRRAVTLAPTSVTAWNNLGLVLARRGDREAASEAFHRAEAIDPADPRAGANLDALGAR